MKSKLPQRWAHRSGSYYYRPRKHEMPFFEGRTWFRLGKTYPEALHEYAARLDLQSGDELSGVIDRYTGEVLIKRKPATQQSYLPALARLREILGHNKVSLIVPQLVYQYIDHIAKVHTMNIANLDLKVLNQVLDSAVRWGATDRNRIKGEVSYFGKRDGLQKERTRYVEDWELQEWSAVATPMQRAFAAICLLTGARKGDILSIHRNDITPHMLTIKSSKTGRPIVFRMTDALREAIAQAVDSQPASSVWLFCNRKGQCYVNDKGITPVFDQAWRRSMKRAIEQTKLEESFTRHDLRAKVGSDADSDERAQQLLGHTSASMTRKHYRRKTQIVDPTR